MTVGFRCRKFLFRVFDASTRCTVIVIVFSAQKQKSLFLVFFFSFFSFFFFFCRTIQHRISSHGTVVVQLVNHSSEEPCTRVFESLHRHTHTRTHIHTIYRCSHMLTVQIRIRNVHILTHVPFEGKKKKKKKKKGNIRKKISENREYLGLIIIVLLYLR